VNWEYNTIKIGATGFMGGKIDESNLDDIMNELGMQGWELTTAFDTNQSYGQTRDVVAIFKRPIAYSDDCGHLFRLKAATHSAGKRPSFGAQRRGWFNCL